jgi:hypothetical protein
MFDPHTNHQNCDNQFIHVFLCQSSKMSQMAYFSGYTQKYLFLTFILFSWMYCGGGFTGKICFGISFGG